jgi:hypothetical protein
VFTQGCAALAQKMVILMMSRKEHLTIEGLHKIVAIRAALNWGISPELKTAFPNITPIQRPLVVAGVIKDSNWLAGFTSGEGFFLAWPCVYTGLRCACAGLPKIFNK